MEAGHPFADRECFEDEVFSGLELPKADCSGREFVRCTFRTLSLPESNWQGTRLDDCIFEACDLTRMRAAKMAARGINFLNCRLMGIDWTELRPNPTVSFDECNLQYASFVNINLTGTRFGHCRLTEAHFIDSRLVDVDFTDSEMSGSRFEHCDVRGADFSRAHGFFIDPAKNKVKDAWISMATAVLLAQSLGLRVTGFDEGTKEGARRR